jgi:hypothetical protein
MPSPFPGMNPYLERAAVWRTFHQNYLYALQAAITGQVDDRYVVQLDTTLYIHEPPADQRRLFGVGDAGVTGGPAAVAAPTAPFAAPVYGMLPSGIEIEEVDRIVIRDREGDELVTVLELLSPTNKAAGADREQYLGKRRQVFRSRTHFVELDLLRGGTKLPLAGLPHCDYYALVSRTEERPRVGIWPWNLRDPMPVIPVPLRAGDPDVPLDLKAALDRIYDEQRYARSVYARPPEPALTPADAAWAAAFVPGS